MSGPLFLALLLGAGSASAEDVGIPVTLRVTNAEGMPIATAKVRHPEEKQLHAVNTANGEWTESVLYMHDGSEFVFEKGTELTLEVSAPGYELMPVKYIVRKRRNVIPVMLIAMEIGPDCDDCEDVPSVHFGRDTPLDK